MSIEDIVEERKRWKQRANQYEANNPVTQKKNQEYAQRIASQLKQGKIIDASLQSWVDSEIKTAQLLLFIGIVLTTLIKGQIFIWLIMYGAYKIRVKQIKQEAWNKNIKDYGRYLK